MMILRYFIGWMVVVTVALAADPIFKTCAKSDFCNRLRYKNEESGYVVDSSTVVWNGSTGSFVLTNAKTLKDLRCSLNAIKGGIFRFRIDELEPSPRFRLDGILDGEQPFELDSDLSFTIFAKPFKLEVKRLNKVIAVINANDRLTVETEEPNVAIAVDVLFPEAQRAYGIPEHADHLSLRSTTVDGRDPYRLFNLDVAYYELESTGALYGSVPVLYAHSASPNRSQTTGIFWHNAAETWVEIDNRNDSVNTYFISESGIVDLFILTGPLPNQAAAQYTLLTGTAPLPQYFTLGHHQSRWNYVSQEDVQTVVAEFDNHDFPLDVMWLDIEYTDNKKYFTWDPKTFPTPLEMQANLTATNRKLVTIIDPHIKKEVGYFVYDQALAQDFFVKNADGSVFEGDCWPGLSSYIDFLHPDALNYFASLYSLDIFNGSTENTYIWNDMNEPAVFDDSTEKTFPKDVLHYGNIKHRDVHNVYGFFQTKATHKGLLDRSNHTKRPFVLTRSHFAGSQRYTAIWTGDNTAGWDYLASSIPMCLTEALAGISFCGADVGGFFYDPSEELLQRWYQVGAWLPFFRAHAHIDTERREPYLFPIDVQDRIRASLQQRYAHLPLWYTLFFEHEQLGEPVIRPLFYNYPEDPNVLDIDTQLIVGNVMVVAVAEPGATSVDVYFPGGETKRWYDASDYQVHRGLGYHSVDVTLDRIPVYYGGGSVIFRKDVPRPSSVDMENDPYTIYIFSNDDKYAEGFLYIDDLESFNYRNGQYAYINVTATNGTVKSTIEHANDKFRVQAKIDRIILVHPSTTIQSASIVMQGGIQRDVSLRHGSNYVEATGLNLDLSVPFELMWQ